MKNVNIGKIIADKLKEINMTQSKLANKLGVSRSLISYYISGKYEIPFQNMVKICQILNLNLNEIYSIYDCTVTEEEMKLIVLYRNLYVDNKAELNRFLEYLIYKQQ